MPRLKKSERERLSALAEGMIREARSADSERILSSNGFSFEHISILHQQQRCANLAWALKYTGRLNVGDVIGIVGGSFSGLMLASALAMCNDVIVYVFEKQARLMQRFLDKSHRYISPNLNSRVLHKAYHPKHGARIYDPPIFKWDGDAASTIAVNWRNEFLAHSEKLPIFCFLDQEVKSHHIQANGDLVALQFDPLEDGSARPQIELNWLIDATGFGEEANPHELVDHSYWESGHRLIYNYLKPKARVLISGCGDSGLIEMMHYALRDFEHDKIDAFWPSARLLDLVIDQSLEAASFYDVTDCEDDWDLEELPLDSEVRWFRGVCRCAAESYYGGPDHLDVARRQIFDAIEKPVLAALNRKGYVAQGDWLAYFDQLPQLEAQDQADIRASLRPVLNDLCSTAISTAMLSIDLGAIFDMEELHALRRPGVDVVLNGRTPTPFTRQLSAFNAWLMHVMLSFPNVHYRKGDLTKVDRRSDGRFDVTFGDMSAETFDRVVTRYGPTARASLISRETDIEPKHNLLHRPMTLVRRGDSGHYIDLAQREIEEGLKRVTKLRVPSSPDHLLEKSFFVPALEISHHSSTENKFPLYSQSKLSKLIKEKASIQYTRHFGAKW